MNAYTNFIGTIQYSGFWLAKVYSPRRNRDFRLDNCFAVEGGPEGFQPYRRDLWLHH